MSELSKTDVQKIVKDEIDKFINNEFEKSFKRFAKNNNSPVRNEIIELIKSSITSVYKFMWLRRDVWKNDIK